MMLLAGITIGVFYTGFIVGVWLCDRDWRRALREGEIERVWRRERQ